MSHVSLIAEAPGEAIRKDSGLKSIKCDGHRIRERVSRTDAMKDKAVKIQLARCGRNEGLMHFMLPK